MGANHDNLGRDKICIRALGLLILMYQNKYSKVLRNGTEMSLLFFERVYDFKKSLNFFYIVSCYNLDPIVIDFSKSVSNLFYSFVNK